MSLPNDPSSSSMAGSELDALRTENLRLRAELLRVREDLLAAGWSSPAPTGPTRPPINGGEVLVLLCVCAGMVLLCALPLLKPLRRITETRLHKIYPVITLVNVVTFVVTFNQLLTVTINDLFFAVVQAIDVVLGTVDQLLVAAAALVVIFGLWKFKDRLMEALGIENAGQVLGDFRDWATCWSMWRFRPIELYIWKVEGLPAAKLHTPNDVFCEVSLGYNVQMRTRVHPRAGQSCVIKETLQLNFDPFDGNNRLHLSVKNQDVVGSTEISSVQMGVTQVRKLEGPPVAEGSRIAGTTGMSRLGQSAWNPQRFHCIELVPAGRIYVSIAPVPVYSEESAGLCWFLCGCCPTRPTYRETLVPSSETA